MAKCKVNPVKETKEIRKMRLEMERQHNFRERVADKKMTPRKSRRLWKQKGIHREAD